jgi:hypothetical protein
MSEWEQRRSGLGHAALEGEEDKVSAAADTEFVEQVGDVEFHSTLGDVEFAGDFLVGEIFEQGVQNFLFSATEIGNGFRLHAAALAGEDGIDEARKHGTRNPETTLGDQRKRASELVAGFGVGKNAFYTQAEQRIGVGVVDGIADDDEARVGDTLENIGEQGAGGLPGRVRVNDIDLRLGRLEVAKVGSQRGFQLLRDDLELGGLAKKALEFGQHQRVRGQQTDCEFRRHSFGSHCT